MRQAWWLGLAVLAALARVSGPRATALAEENKGTVVDLDGLKSAAPAEWKQEPVGEKAFLRHMQFKLPKVGDDKEDAELVIYKGISGSAKDNIARWKGQF